MKKFSLYSVLIIFILFTGCKSIPKQSEILPESAAQAENIVENTESTENPNLETELSSPTITLLFTGDIMAHSVNYKITDLNKIYRDVKTEIESADLTFANLESPLDQTKPTSSYPDFNMSQAYVQAAIDAGFDVFSLCNNHTNDQGLNGIKETIKTVKNLETAAEKNNKKIWFSGLRETENSPFTYNLVEKNGWKILFLPVTELLNRPTCTSYINFVKPDKKTREDFLAKVKKLREENPCDLFVLSLHTSEPEYVRKVSKSQKDFYLQLLDAGVDVVWANHAHLIRDRLFVYNSQNETQKLIMFGNGNVISGQRTNPDFKTEYPDLERDNTGDGLLYQVTFQKRENKTPEIKNVKQFYITTYINTAYEFVLKNLDQNTIMYCNEVKRQNWSKYLERRIKVNENETKDLILWQ